MFGAIVGDVIGSVYEFNNVRSMDFPLFSRFTDFTDDSVMTVAVADAILQRDEGKTAGSKRRNAELYAHKMKEYGRKFPNRGYGGMFRNWLSGDSMTPYRSFGNGSAMRVSPVGFAFDTLEEVLAEAKRCAAVTHNHPEGVKGAQAVASAVFLARRGASKDDIKRFIEERFRYDLNFNLDELRLHYTFNETCQKTVPQAVFAFLVSSDFEDAIRLSISIGGDSDTIACIVGGIAQAFYGKLPKEIVDRVNMILDCGLKRVIQEFDRKFNIHYGV